jgi:hypothetical protein
MTALRRWAEQHRYTVLYTAASVALAIVAEFAQWSR